MVGGGFKGLKTPDQITNLPNTRQNIENANITKKVTKMTNISIRKTEDY